MAALPLGMKPSDLVLQNAGLFGGEQFARAIGACIQPLENEGYCTVFKMQTASVDVILPYFNASTQVGEPEFRSFERLICGPGQSFPAPARAPAVETAADEGRGGERPKASAALSSEEAVQRVPPSYMLKYNSPAVLYDAAWHDWTDAGEQFEQYAVPFVHEVYSASHLAHLAHLAHTLHTLATTPPLSETRMCACRCTTWQAHCTRARRCCA